MKSSFSSLRYKRKINHFFGNDGVFGRLSFLFLFFVGFQFLSAQQDNPKANAHSSILFVGKGVQIISADPSFNKQIGSKTVVLHNASVSNTVTHKERYLVISSKFSTRNLAYQVKDAEKKKKHELLKKVQKQIAKYETAKGKFHTQAVKEYPSTSYFSSNRNNQKDYLVPRTSSHTLDKAIKENTDFSFSVALDFLHLIPSAYYSSKMIKPSFEEAFSIRPPPFLV